MVLDVIILQEHWLWPFKLPLLGAIHPFTAVLDDCLNPESDLRQGCGGVAIIWNKSLRGSPILILHYKQ